MNESPFFVYIIESPSDVEILYDHREGYALGESLKVCGIPYDYNLVTTLNAFHKVMNKILQVIWDRNYQLPIFHFSMHGNEDGVGLTDGNFLSWDDLRNHFGFINSMVGKVPICMSTCHGGSAYKLNFNNRPVFQFLIGSTNTISWSDSAIAYITFYHLFSKLDFDSMTFGCIHKCFRRMKIASGNNNFIFYEGDSVRDYWRQENLKEKIRVAIEKRQEGKTPSWARQHS